MKGLNEITKEVDNKNKNFFFNFGWMKMIGWFSIILFLVDFANRTGKWWFHLIAMTFAITSVGAIMIDIINKKKLKDSALHSNTTKEDNK